LPEDFRGPTAYVREPGNGDNDAIVGAILARYCQDEHDAYLIKKKICGGEESIFSVREKYCETRLEAFRLG
ncbi:MAG: hypothetical protein Q8K46_04395, partial [Deltaproteobacteria bacterium]|nr:hypothetical protein [Deltaproteobacteria bacterium]